MNYILNIILRRINILLIVIVIEIAFFLDFSIFLSWIRFANI